MRTMIHDSSVKLWLSANDTEDWAAGGWGNGSWPCSTLRGRRLFAEFDSNGLIDYTIDGRQPDIDEFNAITSDALRRVALSEDHPCWFVTVGQFIQHTGRPI